MWRGLTGEQVTITVAFYPASDLFDEGKMMRREVKEEELREEGIS